MAADLAPALFEFVLQYGLFAIVICLVLDSAMLMPVLPGELMIALLATRFAHDLPSLALMMLLATVAATAGSFLLYLIARGAGRRYFEKHPRAFMMSPRTRDRMERLFQRPSGQSLVLILRVFPFLRLLVNIPAGLAKMPVLRFLILTFIGNLVFHVGFMYLAYSSRDPGGPVAARADAFRQTYANPAMDFFKEHWVFTALALLVFFLVLSIRGSLRARRRPEEGYGGSLLGWLATTALFWTGVAVVVGLWTDPVLVYDAVALSGYDARGMSLGVPYEPLSVLAGAGVALALLAIIADDLRKSAKRRVKAVQRKPPDAAPVPPPAVDEVEHSLEAVEAPAPPDEDAAETEPEARHD